jgi:transcriptional regulator with XRE-family HTH domain
LFIPPFPQEAAVKNKGPFPFERFGKLFKALRKKRDLTMEDLAQKAKTSKGYISGIEHGKVGTPAPGMAIAMAKGLCIEPENRQMAFLTICDLEKLLPATRSIPSIKDCLNAQYMIVALP